MKNSPVNAISEEVLYAGKIPPHSRELEMNVLGGSIIDNSLIDIVAVTLKPHMFYVNNYGTIYSAMIELRDRGETVDLLTLTEHLKELGKLDMIGGPYILAEISTAYSSSESIQYSADKIKSNWVKREIILLTYSLNEMAYDPTVDTTNLLARLQKDGLDISNELFKRHSVKVSESIKTMLEDVETRAASGKIAGVLSGFKKLDEILFGFEPANLIIIGGRPSHGKTALALCMSINIATGVPEIIYNTTKSTIDAGKEHRHKVGIFSIEMSMKELAMRYISAVAQVEMYKFKSAQLSDDEWKKVTKAALIFQNADIIIDDSNPLTLLEFRAKARRMKAEHGVGIIMVDYLQLMDTGLENKFGTRNDEITFITRGLKATSKDLDIPVIALSQLSRKSEDRPKQKPSLADLRDSGAIEQDADVVMFVHKASEFMTKDDPEYASYAEIVEVLVKKYRNGEKKDIALGWQPRFARAVDKESDSQTFF